MGGNRVCLRWLLPLRHLSMYYDNNYYSIPSLILKELLRKARQAARHRPIHPPLPPPTAPARSWRPPPTMEPGCGGPPGSLPTATFPHTHDSDGSGQEAQGKGCFQAVSLGEWKETENISSGCTGGRQGLAVTGLDGCSSSRPRFKFSRGNAACDSEKVSRFGTRRIICAKHILSLLF